MDDLIPRPDRGPDGQDLEIQALRDSLAMCTTRLRAATEALAQAGHIFETASQAKSEFLATISHEMRTPLNGVLGMLDLALATELSPEQREYLDIAKATAGFLAHVLVDILDFTKVEAGSLVLEQTEFSLRSSLEETVAGYRSQARAKGLGFSWAVPAEVPERLVGDPGRMRQVFRAVLDNAVKFTETGLVEASVSLAGPADGPAVGLMFSVRDTGPGIPEAIRSVVLDPFVQADGSMTRRYGGTGLGLALASRLAERMGGRIWIEEGPEPGSVVRFTLGFGRPARLEESPGQGQKTVGADGRFGHTMGEREAPSADPRLLHILLAEDNPVNQQATRRFLERRGHTVGVAGTGREAVLAHQAASDRGEPFDLVLMDVMMPEMDGLDATRAIRRQEGPGAGRTPVYALTAIPAEDGVRRCREAGMDGFLMKPVTPRELLEVIDRCRGTGAGRAVGFPAGRAVADEPPGEMRAVEDVRGSKGSKDEDVRLDRKEILSRLDNDTVLLGRIVDMYLDQAPEQIAELGRFIAAGDARGLERAAHKLKGSVGYFGAREAMSAALRLEEIGRTGTLAEAGPALDRLERELGRFAKALRDLRKESAA